MKKIILPFLLLGLAGGGLTVSCNRPSEDKVNDAREDVQEAQRDLNDAVDNAQAEWQEFKADAEKKIQEYDAKIADWKAKMANADAKERAKYQEKINDVEAKNNALKQKIQNFKYDSESGWQEFKRELNHDLDEMGNAFKDLGHDNVK